MWTHFWDMSSGGSQKEKWQHIYIEAPENEAKIVFYNRFDHNPERVTCTCCGTDYSISSDRDLARLTAYHRNCAWVDDRTEEGGGHYIEQVDPFKAKWGRKLLTLDEYMNDPTVLFIWSHQIKPGEREGLLPEQGYIWVD